MSENALTRLIEERKLWRKNHPYGFVAKPSIHPSGSLNLMIWHCVIPGKPNTSWENDMYFLRMVFKENYPFIPPVCKFVPPIVNPNVFPCGVAVLSLFEERWSLSVSIKDILLELQYILHEPNISIIARHDAFILYCYYPDKYETVVRARAKISKAECLKCLSETT